MTVSKRIISGVLAVLMVAMAFTGCNKSDTETNSGTANDANTTESTAAKETADSAATADVPLSGNKYTIGICQLVQHEALDAATKGFMDVLKEKLGDNVTFDEQNAQGDSANCATICNTFVSGKYDLIMANATPALQAAASSTAEIPILGTSITHYGTALDIADWKGYTETNISGTADLAPLDEQAKMMKELFPDAKTVGILYCSAEANSKYQYDTIKPLFEQDGYEVKEYTFSDSNDISAVVTSACDECEVLYIPTDNTAANNTGVIDNIASTKNIPIITGEEGLCSGCGVATLSISYYELGRQTGEMAFEILEGGADVSKMEIRFAPATTKKYDKDRCEALGVKIPDGYEAIVKSE